MTLQVHDGHIVGRTIAVYKNFSSGDSAMPHGRSPTSMDAVISFVIVSMMKIRLPRPELT
jgi:hypothetical protein